MRRLQLEHFVHGSFDDVGYRTVSTTFLHELISNKTLDYLRGLKGENVGQTLIGTSYIAVTRLTASRDKFGRETTWNHTILVPVAAYLKLAWANRMSHVFEKHWIPPTGELLRRLDPITITEK